jgi:4-amino-4-deoxy-L-arabinose transferase-like glycosyltransferase
LNLFHRLKQHPRLFDILWVVALGIFVVAGMMQATFHGDEAMQIYMSHDYATLFIYRHPEQLLIDRILDQPYDIDNDPWLRILNGSINRYAIGLSWHLAGLNDGLLPPRPGWDWGLEYGRNVETGHRPSDTLLAAGRISSTLFLALSAAVMFGIGWQMGGRRLAYIVSGLYAVNPILLLNGRRAMMEGSMLFFGLLALLTAAVIAKNRAAQTDSPSPNGPTKALLRWAALIVAAGLALASKHSGILFVAGAFGWIFAAEIIGIAIKLRQSGRKPTRHLLLPLLTMSVKLVVSAVLSALLFIALSPALWHDTPTRLQDLIYERQRLLDMQVKSDPLAPTTLMQRVEGTITQPFMTPPVHFEVAFWAKAEPIISEINRYMASPISGIQFGAVTGGLLTLLAGLGIFSLIWPRLRAGEAWTSGILVWVVANVGSLLVNPLPWQRYYLPWIPAAIVLTGLGIVSVIGRFVNKL